MRLFERGYEGGDMYDTKKEWEKAVGRLHYRVADERFTVVPIINPYDTEPPHQWVAVYCDVMYRKLKGIAYEVISARGGRNGV